jgi:adenylate cyclase
VTPEASAEDSAGSSRPTREDLQREILREEPSLTVDEIVEDAEARAVARQLWRALGFADPVGTVAFTQADREAMSTLFALVTSGQIDNHTAVRLTRAIGQTMARLADWQVATLTEFVEGLEEAGLGSGSRLRTGLGLIKAVQSPVEDLMMYAWRRHLAAAVSRVEALGAADSDLHSVTMTVGFADLVRFTQLTNGLGEEDLAELVEEFESACADLVTGGGGRVIKTLGDSVLFVVSTPWQGVDIAADIVTQIGGDPMQPDVHVGIATGQVLRRLGDVFGPPVNLASRLTALARRNRVICDDATANALRGRDGYALRPLTERTVRGFGSLRPFTVRRLEPSEPSGSSGLPSI